MLQKDALDRTREEEAKSAIGQAEAFFRLDEFLDQFESGLEEQSEQVEQQKQAEQGLSSESKLKWSGINNIPGFALEYEDNPVHMAGFSK
jgi:hypothetical protein